MNKEILDFLNRRFPIQDNDPCHWMGENDYYFARILKARFKGELFYDLTQNHFLFKQGDYFYDWTGVRTEYDLNKEWTVNDLVRWSDYKEIDETHYDRIVRDVID